MDSAMSQVMLSPELLEMILVQMDMRSLLTSAQRVCHRWASLINKSPSIQKALFFTPIKPPEWGTDSMQNPLLVDAFPSFFPAKDRPDRFKFDFSNLAATRDEIAMARFVRKDASWRRMLVQQPPIENIGLYHITHGRGGDRAESYSIPPDHKMHEAGYDGLRMERLFELLLFNGRVQFLPFTKARVYWSCEEPISFNESRGGNNELFHEMLSKFDLMLYTRRVTQCCRVHRPPSPQELTRIGIIVAYEEQGLDARAKKEEINMSETNETL